MSRNIYWAPGRGFTQESDGRTLIYLAGNLKQNRRWFAVEELSNAETDVSVTGDRHYNILPTGCRKCPPPESKKKHIDDDVLMELLEALVEFQNDNGEEEDTEEEGEPGKSDDGKENEDEAKSDDKPRGKKVRFDTDADNDEEQHFFFPGF